MFACLEAFFVTLLNFPQICACRISLRCMKNFMKVHVELRKIIIIYHNYHNIVKLSMMKKNE